MLVELLPAPPWAKKLLVLFEQGVKGESPLPQDKPLGVVLPTAELPTDDDAVQGAFRDICGRKCSTRAPNVAVRPGSASSRGSASQREVVPKP